MTAEYPKFPYTPEGFVEAKQWLIEQGKWDDVKDQDGYTVVYYANQGGPGC